MKNAVKGVILSGLVLPGLGQVVLKSYKRGIALILIVVAAFSAIVISAVRLALTVLEKVEAKGGPVDMESVTQVAAQAVGASDQLLINLALLLIFACWVVSIVDAYTTGRKLDLKERA